MGRGRGKGRGGAKRKAAKATAGTAKPSSRDVASNNARWMDRYEELKDYQREYGHCNVPQKCKDNPQLGKWVKNQRKDYKLREKGKKSAMTDGRIALLEEVGFEWAVERKDHDKWELRCNELKEFKRKHGHCKVPTKCKDNPQLGQWVDTQRQQYRRRYEGKHSLMTDEREAALNSIGFQWSLKNGTSRGGNDDTEDADNDGGAGNELMDDATKDGDEENASSSVPTENDEDRFWSINAIVGHRKIKGGWYEFCVSWEGFEESTWEYDTKLKKDAKLLFGKYLHENGLYKIRGYKWAKAKIYAPDDEDGFEFSVSQVMADNKVPKPRNWPDDVAFIGNNFLPFVPNSAEELDDIYVALNARAATKIEVNKKVEIRPSTLKHKKAGMGLHATEDILPGHVVGIYFGHIQELSDNNKSQYICEYFLGDKQDPSGKKRKVVDAKLAGNEMRFINHSKAKANVAASCEGSKGSTARRLIKIRAAKKIEKGAEIFWDYGDKYSHKAF